jgi:ABC-type lipoprotein release transport system permease subunit
MLLLSDMRMIFSLAMRNAARNVVRTALTAGMVVLGVGLLSIMFAWVDGVSSTMTESGADSMGHIRVVDPEFAAREQLMPLYENLPDAGPIVEAVRTVPGVTGAYARIITGATLSAGEEIGDVFGMAVGADPEWYAQGLDLPSKVIAGSWFVGDGEGQIVLGRKLAERTGAVPGDEILVLSVTQDGSPSAVKAKLAGVVAAGNPLIDQQLFLPLERMQYLVDLEGGAIEVVAYVEDPDDAPAIAAQVRALSQTQGLTVEAWNEREPWSSMLPMISTMRGVLVTIVVFITALGVWNTMMMSVLERTDEIGVMRAMGLGRVGAVSLFVLEASVIALLGGLLGVLLGGAAGLYLESVGLTLGEQVTQNTGNIALPETIYADVTAATTLQSFLLGLCMAVLGSALPAIRAAAIQPVTAMRAKR